MTAGYDARMWYEQIPLRHSVRSYDGRPVPDEVLDGIRPFLSGFSELCRGARGVILDDAGELFTGILGPLGVITGVSVAVAFAGDLRVPEHMEAVGYLGEGVILQATSLGLGTCWVSGTFDRQRAASRVKLGPHERVLAVTPLGYASERENPGQRLLHSLAGSSRRRPLEAISGGLEQRKWPSGLREALEASRLAPSAMNRQPWFFRVAGDCVTLLVRGAGSAYGSSRRLDCGIVMLHFEVAARATGLEGRWEWERPPAVARFVFS